MMRIRLPRISIDQRWFIALICVLGAIVLSGIVNVSTHTQPSLGFSQQIGVLEDRQRTFTIADVAALPESTWRYAPADRMVFGMASYPYWFRFTVPAGDSDVARLLEIDYALLDTVDVWFYVGKTQIRHHKTGDRQPFNERDIPHEKVLIDVPAVSQSITVVIRTETAGTVRMPIRLWEKDAFAIYNGEHNFVMGLFFGFMLAMALSNLFFFATTRSLKFLTYFSYVTCLAITLATLHGLAYKYLWPNMVWLQARSVGIFATLTILFALIFSMQLLNIRAVSRVMYQLMRIASLAFAVGVLVALVVPYAIYIKFLLALMIPAVLLVYGAGITLWIRKVPLAQFYTIAWTAMLLAGFVTSLDNANLIQIPIPSHYLLMFGASVETFLLALALAMSYSKQRQEQDEEKRIALLQEKLAAEAKDQMITLQEEAQEALEYKVQERTLELEIALRELSETNRELEKRNTTDSLTNIRNRRYFDKKYVAEVRRSRREQTELSVAMVDIDHFKKINDNYGHVIGDECIRFVASILQESLKRPSDDACRYGGEEFAILLPNTSAGGAYQLVEEIRHKLENTPLQTASGVLKMTLSAGVCTAVIQSQQDENQLLECADKALYQAKQQGRNCVATGKVPAIQAVNQE